LITGFLHHLGFNASQSDEIQTALKNKISGKSWVLKGRKALLYKGNLLSEQDQHPFVSVIWQSAQEPLLLGNYQLRVLSTIKTSNEQEKSWLVSLDVKKVSFPLEIRPWKKGDYFYPEKGKGKVLLSDFFSNLGIDQFTRSKLPLLCKENQILSVPFFRNDARALATKDVRQKLHIQIKKI
jgi:tRNA(Ile)-lysidine synthase